jgi:hypothetical protein
MNMPQSTLGPKTSNSAKRLFDVLSDLHKVKDKNVRGNDHTTTDALALQFGFTDRDIYDQRIFAATVLSQLYGQVQLSVAQLKASGLSPSIYSADFKMLREYANPVHTGSQWKSVKDHITSPPVMNTLAWAQEVLPEDEMGEGDIVLVNAGLEQLQQLREILQDSTVDEAVSSFLESKLKDLEIAFRVVPLAGRQLLWDEIDKATSLAHRRAPEFMAAVQGATTSESSKSAMQAYAGVVRTGAEATGMFSTFYEGAKNAIEFVGNVTGLLS